MIVRFSKPLWFLQQTNLVQLYIVSVFESYSMTAMPFHKKKCEDKQVNAAAKVNFRSTSQRYRQQTGSGWQNDNSKLSRGRIFLGPQGRFMSGVCFIAPPSQDADALLPILLQRGLTSWCPPVFMGHQYGSQVMNYLANKPSTTTC